MRPRNLTHLLAQTMEIHCPDVGARPDLLRREAPVLLVQLLRRLSTRPWVSETLGLLVQLLACLRAWLLALQTPHYPQESSGEEAQGGTQKGLDLQQAAGHCLNKYLPDLRPLAQG